MFQPDAALKARLEDWIDKNSAAFFADVAALVAIRSVSQPDGTYPYGAGCAKVLEQALALAEGYGFTTRNLEYQCGACELPGVSGKKQIGMFAHLDVVPEGEDWTFGPYNCTERDGYLIGRGVGDNKGPAISALYAMRFLREAGLPLQNNLLLYFGCAEETGMADLEYYVAHYTPPDFALVPDNSFPVCFGEKGIMRFYAARECTGNLAEFTAGQVVNVVPAKAHAVLTGISAQQLREHICAEGLTIEAVPEGVKLSAIGLSTHAAFPEGSVNALHVLAQALTDSGLLTGSAAGAVAAAARLTADSYGASTGVPLSDEQSGRLTCVGSVARLENGKLVLRYDTRYPVTCNGADVAERLRTHFVQEGFALSELSDDPPSYVPPDEPVVPALCDIAEYVLGKRHEPYTMGGGTYARKLPRALGFGPGVPGEVPPCPAGRGNGHQPDECIRKAVLLDGLRAYVYALLELDRLL